MIEIPGYRILRPLGQGGMATVYLAVQESLGREVALKVLAPSLAQDPVSTERFLREARTAAKLHHPHIIAVHDVGVHAGTPFMSISYEPGGTVAQKVHEGEGLDQKSVFRIIRDIAEALDYAHRQGVVHRDVKPENILLRADGHCVLSDFGIAHAMESAQTGLTREGTSVGTPHYMSPEQLRGEHGDGRADLYSLGVLFYQLLTGELPYQGTDGWAIGISHMTKEIPRLPDRYSYLQELLEGLLAKEPGARLQSGAEVVRWLDARVSLQTPAMTIAMPTPRGGTSTGNKPQRVSLAVLPFVDLSPAKDQEYFVEGLTEELLNLLARVPQLHVASRTATATLRGRNVSLSEMGRELKVASVLEGSVRKAGERVRIAVQLINVADGYNLWSETYNRDLTDVFAVQEELAIAMVEALKDKLLPHDPDSPEQELGRQLQLAREKLAGESREDAEAAVAAFAKVLAIDPNHAEAKYGSAAAQRALTRFDASVAAGAAAERAAQEARAAAEAARAEAERAAREAREAAAADRAAAEKAAQEAREAAAAERAAAERLAQEAAAERAAAEQREREHAARAEAEARRREAAEKAAAEAQERERLAAARAAEEARQREQAAVAAAVAAEQARQREAEAKAAEEAKQREAAAKAAEDAKQREAAAKAAEETKQREAAAKAAEEAKQREAAAKSAEEAKQREAMDARRKEAEAANALLAEQTRQREAAARAAAEHRQADEMQALAEKRRREMEAQEKAAAAAAASAAAAAAGPQSTLVVPPRQISPEMAAAQTPKGDDRLGGARQPDPADRAIAFASAMDQRTEPVAPPPVKKKGSPLPLVIGGVVVLALAAVGVWKFMGGPSEADIAACNGFIAGTRTALTGGDVAAAEAALASARTACTGAQAAPLEALAGEVATARTQAQACEAAEAQATTQLDQGLPLLARGVLDGVRAQCAPRPAFAALDTRAQGAEAEARRLFAEAAAQFKAGDVAAADATLKQALAADAALADTQVLRAEIDKRLATMPPPAEPVAPPAPTPAETAAAKPPEPKPAEPKPPVTAPETPTATVPPPPPKPVTPTPTPAPTPTTTAPTPAPLPAPPPPVAATPEPAPTPAAPTRAKLVPISTPQPPYPVEALRSKQAGQVIATFTVNADGSVGNVRIVKSTPRGVFDRTVENTVERWRFQPIEAQRDVTQTFTFAR